MVKNKISTLYRKKVLELDLLVLEHDLVILGKEPAGQSVLDLVVVVPKNLFINVFAKEWSGAKK